MAGADVSMICLHPGHLPPCLPPAAGGKKKHLTHWGQCFLPAKAGLAPTLWNKSFILAAWESVITLSHINCVNFSRWVNLSVP